MMKGKTSVGSSADRKEGLWIVIGASWKQNDYGDARLPVDNASTSRSGRYGYICTRLKSETTRFDSVGRDQFCQ